MNEELNRLKSTHPDKSPVNPNRWIKIGFTSTVIGILRVARDPHKRQT